VLEATNGRDALRVVHAHPREIDLMLTDVVMPEMGGRRSAEQVLLARPEIKILFMSGHAGPEHPMEPGALIQKPFTPELLARRVRETLDAT
jgi:CheY-like chemotaxis protein